jgi:hypothetical protein
MTPSYKNQIGQSNSPKPQNQTPASKLLFQQQQQKQLGHNQPVTNAQLATVGMQNFEDSTKRSEK